MYFLLKEKMVSPMIFSKLPLGGGTPGDVATFYIKDIKKRIDYV